MSRASLHCTGRLALAALSLALVVSCSSGGTRGDGGTPRTDATPAMCTPTCTAGQNCCESGGVGRCANPLTDPNNCGRCGISCGVGGTCSSGMCTGGMTDSSVPPPDGSSGMCTPSCSSAQRCCGTSCVNRSAPAGTLDGRSDSSFANCNGCGLSCDPDRGSVCGQMLGGSGPPQCLCGNFAQCPPGQVCVNGGSAFTCADLNSDPNNCGTIGNACNEGESCVGGTCGCGGTGAACGAGQACCGGACVDTTADGMNCGGCGVACPASAPSCNAGSCGCGTGPACTAPVAGALGMGGMPGESCCDGTCVANTDTSCACMACDTAGGDTCQVGGGGIIPGMGGDVSVCCGDSSVAILGCGGGLGGDGGLPFP